MRRLKDIYESTDTPWNDYTRSATDGLDAIGIHRIENPEVFNRLNAVVNAHLNKTVTNVKEVLDYLRAKLNIGGYDFAGDYRNIPYDDEYEIPLNRFGGRFGRGTEDDFYAIAQDDGIEPFTGQRYSLFVTITDDGGLPHISGYIAPVSDGDGINEAQEVFTAVAIVNNKVVQSIPIAKKEIKDAIEFLKATHRGAKVSIENSAGRVIQTEQVIHEDLDSSKAYIIQQNGKKYVLGTPVKSGSGEMRRPKALHAAPDVVTMVNDKSLNDMIKQDKISIVKAVDARKVKYTPPPPGKLNGSLKLSEDIANVASSGEVAGLGSEPPAKKLKGATADVNEGNLQESWMELWAQIEVLQHLVGASLAVICFGSMVALMGLNAARDFIAKIKKKKSKRDQMAELEKVLSRLRGPEGKETLRKVQQIRKKLDEETDGFFVEASLLVRKHPVSKYLNKMVKWDQGVGHVIAVSPSKGVLRVRSNTGDIVHIEYTQVTKVMN